MVTRYSLLAAMPAAVSDPAGKYVAYADYTAMVAARDILQTHYTNCLTTVAVLKAQIASLNAQLAARSGPTGTVSTRE